MTWPFYVCAAVAIFSTLRVITNKNAVHAMLALISSFMAVAGMFFCIGAPFAAALEIIVYAGAILVLFVFVVMMMNIGTRSSDEEKKWLNSSAWAFPATSSFVLLVAMIAMTSNTGAAIKDMGTQVVSAKDVGMALFSQYILVVEVASMLLLGALVAAYHLGKKRVTSSDQNDARGDQ